MIKKISIILIFLMGLLTSCIESNQLEKLAIIHSRGIDVSDDGQIDATMAIFQFQAQSEEFTKIVTGRGSTIKGTINHASNESDYKLVPGKLQVEVYGAEVAKDGLTPFLDTLKRDARVPDRVYLTVSDTTAKEILMTPPKKITTNIGQYLQGVIEESAANNYFPKVTLQEFGTTANMAGKDPILPVFSIGDLDVPEINSIAIFSEDKQVGTLPIEELELFNLMTRRVEARTLEITLPTEPLRDFFVKEPKEDSIHTAYTIEKGKSKIKQDKKDELSFITEINMDLSLVELSDQIDLDNPESIKAIEKEIEKKISSRYEDIMQQLQEMKADPFGYGIIYRINTDDGKLEPKEWKEIYPDINVEFKVNTRITRHGTINI
ncbi:Ger(x)C family spore germination protein [Ornithinibacillus sp. L9]|uniref:Ger(X)C family spore germination protein n=1 Tax=Ornithinibacillus caprae TaxID=2678566 RepID=A0A6N8FKF0_9BACI|nr:Ger(x)C family spore germination protein [Ornithinibacillus caprae]MUK88794.1 Ger(x)C family spore germination protein [Ornithinibacillus caprae]